MYKDRRERLTVFILPGHDHCSSYPLQATQEGYKRWKP
jgi:hypothetical protein